MRGSSRGSVTANTGSTENSSTMTAPDVDQRDVAEGRADRIREHAEAARHGLHPGVAARALGAFRASRP